MHAFVCVDGLWVFASFIIRDNRKWNPSFIKTFVIDGKRKATVEDVLAIGRGREVKLSSDSKYHDLLRESKVVLLEHMEGGKKVYGATTSYGDAVTTVVHYKRSIELNFAALYNSGCGIGPLFPEDTCR